MRLHRFIGNYNLSRDSARTDDQDLIRQLSRVLRLGRRLVLCVEMAAVVATYLATNGFARSDPKRYNDIVASAWEAIAYIHQARAVARAYAPYEALFIIEAIE